MKRIERKPEKVCQSERTKRSLLGAGLIAFPDKMVALLVVNVRKRLTSFLTGLEASAFTSCLNPLRHLFLYVQFVNLRVSKMVRYG